MPRENDYIPWPVKGYGVPQDWLPKRTGGALHDGLVSGLGVTGAAVGGVAGKIGGGILGGVAGSAIGGPVGATVGTHGGSLVGSIAGSTAGGLGGAWVGHGISRIPDWLDEAPSAPNRSRPPQAPPPRQRYRPSTEKGGAGQPGGKTASAREQAKVALRMSDEAFSRIPGHELDRILRALG